MLLSFLLSCLLLQDTPKQEPLEFRFRNADVAAVLEYVSRSTGYVFVNEAAFRGTVDAVSATPVSKRDVLEFLNTVLRPKGVTALSVNERVIRIVTLKAAQEALVEIHVGADPEKVEPTDRILTQVIPLKNLRVEAFDRDLRSLIPQSAKYAKDAANNALVITDSGSNIRRMLRLVATLDGKEFQPLKMKVIALENALASKVKETLSSFVQGRGPGNLSWSKIWQRHSEGKLEPSGATSEIVKILADERTNSVILTATEKNLSLLEGFVKELDGERAQSVSVKTYEIKGPRASEVANTISQLFQPNSRDKAGGLKWNWADAEVAARITSAFPIKAVANSNKNTVMVTATPEQIRLVDELVLALDYRQEFRLFGLTFADAEKVSGLLAQISAKYTPKPTFNPDKRTNTLFVRATEEQMREIELVLAEIDREVIDSVQTRVYTIQNAEPREVSSMLSSVFAGDAGLSRPIKFVTNERTSTLLVKAPQEYFSLIDDIIDHLDSVAPDAEMTYVVELKTASPSKVAKILRSLTGGEIQTNTPSGLRPHVVHTAQQPQGGGNPQKSPIGPTMQRSGLNNLGPRSRQEGQDPPKPEPAKAPIGPGRIQVEGDDDSNVLVVKASKRDMARIKEIIEGLDKYRPQVLVKVLIVEVTLDDDLKFGVQASWENGLTLPGGDAALQKLSTALGVGGGGLGWTVSSSAFDLSLQALAEAGKLKVLATPRILVTDNHSAKFSVGKSVPMISDSRQTPEGSVLNTVQYAEVGIILDVTPKVHADGMVHMAIRPEVSDVAQAGGVTISPGSNAPTFIKNFADTTLSVKDGRTVILGGLIRELQDYKETKVPILGDIPFIGGLFSNQTLTQERRELMIFITPHVVKSQWQLEELTELEIMQLKLIPHSEILMEVERWLDDIP